MKAKVKILFYAINGLGLGHLSRQYAIARNLRRLLQALDISGDIRFLTTSEAPQFTRDFPTYKLPSKTVLAANRIGGYVEQSKFFISNLVASFRPEILVMDTLPEGSFQEFFFLKDFARRSVFIDRQKDPASAQSRMHLSHLGLYDLVLVPDDESAAEAYPLPEAWAGQRRFIGPVTLFEGGIDKAALRRHFGFEQAWPVVYVSVGGGGDAAAREQMDALLQLLAAQRYYVLAGYRPLFEGQMLYRPNVVPLNRANVSPYFTGIDFALSAAGYNSYQELLAAGVPTLFYAQAKGLDRQDQRIAGGLAAGWHGQLDALTPEALAAGLAWLQREGPEIRARLGRRPRPQGALRGAYELLKLHSDLPGSPVDWKRLTLAMAQLLPWTGERDEFAEYYRWRQFCWLQLSSPAERQQILEQAVVYLHAKTPALLAPLPDRQLEVLIQEIRQFQQKTAFSETQLQNLLKPYLQQVPGQEKNGLISSLAGCLEVLRGADLAPVLLEHWFRKTSVHLRHKLERVPDLTLRLAEEGRLEACLEWLVSADPEEIEHFFNQLLEEMT
ncbi:MAG: hypothetical protein ACAI44_05750 [Candidatus Sericytochromatia bacterium]